MELVQLCILTSSFPGKLKVCERRPNRADRPAAVLGRIQEVCKMFFTCFNVVLQAEIVLVAVCWCVELKLGHPCVCLQASQKSLGCHRPPPMFV